MGAWKFKQTTTETRENSENNALLISVTFEG